MTVPSIGGVNVPDSMASRGIYTFQRQPTRDSGAGVAVAFGQQKVVWLFPYMTQTEFDWWVARLGGGVSATVACVLWDDANTFQSFTAGELHRPRSARYTGALYYDVAIEITYLAPLLT